MEPTVDGTDMVRCAECRMPIHPNARPEVTDAGTFCRTCFDQLSNQVRRAVAAQSEEINYFLAALGGLAGGLLGAVVWWGFTVATEMAFGLVAIVIGIAVGKGVVIASGGKRSFGLQVLSVTIASLAFFLASYWVNRSFINDSPEFLAQGAALPLIPSPALAIEIVSLTFEVMDLIFLGIVIWEAWTMPAPLKLEG